MKTILVRKEEYGGKCGICGCKVLLFTDRDPWMLNCLCGTVPVPVWVTIDNYSKTQYRRHFQTEFLPSEAEGSK